MGIVFSILAFGLMIFIHEWGHFIAARRCGVYVEEFALGMGPVLLKKKSQKTGTVYALRLLPIGGFCQMLGETASSVDQSFAGDGVPEEETSKLEGAFSSKSVGARFLITVAGPLMNLIFAFIIGLVLTLVNGYSVAVISNVEEGFHAAEAGLEAGDQLIEVNGRKIHIQQDVTFALLEMDETPVELVVEKTSGERKTITVPTAYDEAEQRYRLGIWFGSYRRGLTDLTSENGIGEQLQAKEIVSLIAQALYQTFWTTAGYVELVFRGFAMLFSGRAAVSDMMGPIGMVSQMGQTYTEAAQYSLRNGLEAILELVVLLSVNLGVMNMIPIPGLDGSRVIFLLIEKIRGKSVSPKVEGAVYLVGFVLLMLLMLLISGQDVLRLFR